MPFHPTNVRVMAFAVTELTPEDIAIELRNAVVVDCVAELRDFINMRDAIRAHAGTTIKAVNCSHCRRILGDMIPIHS